jgi:CubicO group peptidase (beta-lactamase class C family)
MRFLIALVLISGVARASCHPKSLAEVRAGVPALEASLRALMAEKEVGHEIEALSVTLAAPGEVIYRGSFGVGTKFQAASISKPVFSLLALRLLKAGEIDEPLTRFVKVPYLPPQPYVDLVTARTVLSHTSGLSNDVSGEDRQIHFKPGTRYSYSGGGFVYLQQAIEDRTGRRLTELGEGMFRSLGMADSSYDLAEDGKHWVSAAYSLVTTPDDLMRFLQALVSPPPEWRAASQAMQVPQVAVSAGVRYGLGIRLGACGGATLLHHSGRNNRIHLSFAGIYAGSGIGIVVMARGKGAPGIPQKIAAQAIGAELEP